MRSERSVATCSRSRSHTLGATDLNLQPRDGRAEFPGRYKGGKEIKTAVKHRDDLNAV